jgi:heptaprenyl diphosphate synthase
MITTADLANLLDFPELPKHLKQVEEVLIKALTVNNSSLMEPSLRLIKNGGKRLRPFFVLAAAKSQGKEINKDVILASAAVELVHIGTIVHDDIIDNADIRWGVPTINSKEGTSQAIVIGDYLLSLSASIAASVSAEVAGAIAAATMHVCDGQIQETSDEYNINRSLDSYMTSIRDKTAALTSAACRVGALCAGLSDMQVKALAEYGEWFGMSFQIIDDLLDFLSTSEAMGKPVGNDIKEGVYTLPLLLALQKPAGKELRSLLSTSPEEINYEKIVKTLKEEGAFEETIKKIRTYNSKAANTISQLGTNSITLGLAKLPSSYLSWALRTKVITKL